MSVPMLRVDTPPRVVAHARFRRSSAPALVIAFWFGVSGLLGVLFGTVGGHALSLAVGLALLIPLVAWVGWLRRRARAVACWDVDVRIGGDVVVAAHRQYRLLTDDGRERAMPLIEAMYRLARVDVTGSVGRAEVRDLMQKRVTALERLVAAEDRMRLELHRHNLDDTDDLDTADAWQAAVAEVEAQMAADDPTRHKRHT